MRSLNKRSRSKNYVTDILSFNYGEIGELYICLPQAMRQARRYHVTIQEEIRRLIAHGLLHLAGLDHEKSKSEARIMFSMQDTIAQWASAPDM